MPLNAACLQSLKECSDEIDLGTQYHLTRYAFLFESTLISDGTTLIPPKDDGTISALLHTVASLTLWALCSATNLGLKTAIEMIDNRGDFKVFMQNYAYAHGGTVPRGPRREGPADEGFVSLILGVSFILTLTIITVTSNTFSPV